MFQALPVWKIKGDLIFLNMKKYVVFKGFIYLYTCSSVSLYK